MISSSTTTPFYVWYMFQCCCVVIPFILDGRLVDAPAGVTQEEGRTVFIHLPSAGLTLIFIAREEFGLPFPSSTVKSNFVYPRFNRSPLVGHDFFFFFSEESQFV